MGLFHRVGGIISANLSELVERLEDPEIMLRQSVRDMEQAVSHLMQAAASVVAEERLLGLELARHREAARSDYELARRRVGTGQIDAARRALLSRRQHEQLAATFEPQHAAAQRAAQKLRRRLDAQRRRLAATQHQLAVCAALRRAAQTRDHLLGTHGPTPLVAAERFDLLRSRLARAEAEAQALEELSGAEDDDALAAVETAELEAQLQALVDENCAAPAADLKQST